MPAQFPPGASPFRGLPGGRCQCPHLGYVISGSFRVTYGDGREKIVRSRTRADVTVARWQAHTSDSIDRRIEERAARSLLVVDPGEDGAGVCDDRSVGELERRQLSRARRGL
jgi:hypothetical protein